MSAIGSFNNFELEKNIMRLQGGYWVTDVDLLPGDHRYKFLINGVMKLNDPVANLYLPDENEELWTVISINQQNQRLYNNQQYTVNLKGYCLTNCVTDQRILRNKQNFDKATDKKVVARFEFDHIAGLHTVTALWVDCYGRFYKYSENSLYTDRDKGEESVFLWFWIDLDNTSAEGVYSLKLFIDGSFVLEDEIRILSALTYLHDGYPHAKLYNEFNEN
jgi:hypothetical protein